MYSSGFRMSLLQEVQTNAKLYKYIAAHEKAHWLNLCVCVYVYCRAWYESYFLLTDEFQTRNNIRRRYIEGVSSKYVLCTRRSFFLSLRKTIFTFTTDDLVFSWPSSRLLVYYSISSNTTSRARRDNDTFLLPASPFKKWEVFFAMVVHE